ncbi:hypothetical protein GUJ93_ZPchr0001g29560 [Zizania palustris]|uniref:60S ribosomal protein L36 n=1 Tax=Zizania palustris TaxID=103762 RepID=A0A8J5VCX6_ZIZPA|nr:hypothetical protein GUJ93_ZPchr0001g29560 [Zizania palustris]
MKATEQSGFSSEAAGGLGFCSSWLSPLQGPRSEQEVLHGAGAAQVRALRRHQQGPRRHQARAASSPFRSQGENTKRVNFVRCLIREVAGLAPYEKRITELLKVGKDKRALKVAKRKLALTTEQRRREEMAGVTKNMWSAGVSDKKK